MSSQTGKNYELKVQEIHDLKVLMNEVKTYITEPVWLTKITQAYEFAKQKHGKQVRANGDPYIYHPLTTAYFLAQYKMGPTTIIAGLLHDVVEDTPVQEQEIIDTFGQEVNMLVQAVTKVSYFAKENREQLKATYLRRLYLSMAQDIRVMIIKICDRLHNMLTIGNLLLAKQQVIAQETLDTYATIAQRIGMNSAKSWLEDMSFKVLDPDSYAKVAALIALDRKTRDVEIKKIIIDLNYFLTKEKQIGVVRIFGREKTVYSIYRKMTMFGKTFDEINDLLAVRIIAQNVDDCYKILGFIDQKYLPIPGRFKDYIATPKNNLYQSLHTTVANKNGLLFEVQIRTDEMDQYAEFGAAAHWRYKADDEVSVADKQKEIDDKLDIFRRIISLNSEEGNQELEKELKEDIFTSTIYVLTPNGQVIALPYGSTVLDFAFRIHSEVGEHAIGAKINGVFLPLNTVLHSGEMVEIKTSPTQTPNHNWLQIVKTSNAKNRIKKYLAQSAVNESETLTKKEEREQMLMRTKSAISAFLNANDLKGKRWSEKETIELIRKDGFQTLDDVYWEVANNRLKIEDVVAKYLVNPEFNKDNVILDQLNKTQTWAPEINNDLIVDGISNMQVEIANCCLPIPFEAVVGYVSKGKGIKVHLPYCVNVSDKQAKARLVNVHWNQARVGNKSYVTKIKFSANDRPNLLYDITRMLSSLKAAIISASANTNQKTYLFTGVIKLKVNNSDQLNQIISSMKIIPGLLTVERVVTGEEEDSTPRKDINHD